MATSAWQTTPGAHWPLAPAAGAQGALWPLARWHVACRAELCSRFCRFWLVVKWEKVEELLCTEGFGHKRWKM